MSFDRNFFIIIENSNEFVRKIEDENKFNDLNSENAMEFM